MQKSKLHTIAHLTGFLGQGSGFLCRVPMRCRRHDHRGLSPLVSTRLGADQRLARQRAAAPKFVSRSVRAVACRHRRADAARRSAEIRPAARLRSAARCGRKAGRKRRQLTRRENETAPRLGPITSDGFAPRGCIEPDRVVGWVNTDVFLACAPVRICSDRSRLASFRGKSLGLTRRSVHGPAVVFVTLGQRLRRE